MTPVESLYSPCPAMGSSSAHDNFVLRWNDFQSNVASSFRDLRLEEDFFDVTLACDEDHQLQAHKVVLAASSAFFRGMLRRNPAQHPVLVMPPNVRFSELAALLDFVYHGEVTVPNDELNSLLRLANLLKVKGLVDEKEKAAKDGGPGAKGGSSGGPGRFMTQQQYQQHKVPKLPPGVNIKRRPVGVDEFAGGAGGPPPPAKQKHGFPDQSHHQGEGSSSGSSAPMKEYSQRPPPPPPPHQNSGGPQGPQDSGHEYAEVDSQQAFGKPPLSQYQADAGTGQPPPLQGPDMPEGGMQQSIAQHPPAQPMPPQPQQPAPQAPAGDAAGTRFIALQCPKCPEQLPGTDAFRKHMEDVHPVSGQQQQQHLQQHVLPETQQQPKKKKKGRPPLNPPQPSTGGDEEVPQPPVACGICDKEFRNKRYMVAHQKRVHKIESDGTPVVAGAAAEAGGAPPTEKKRGRPKKKKPLPPPGEEEYPPQPQEEGMMYDEGPGGAMPPQGARRQHQHQRQRYPPDGAGRRPFGEVHPAKRSSTSERHDFGDGEHEPDEQPGRAIAAARGRQQRQPSSSGDPLGSPMRRHLPGDHEEEGMDMGGKPVPGTSSGYHHHPQQQRQHPGPSAQHLRQQRPFSHGRGRGGGSSLGRGPQPQQQKDLKRSLGLKFGGHISITSSDHHRPTPPPPPPPRGPQPGPSGGLYKGSMYKAASSSQAEHPHHPPNPPHQQQQQQQVEVKQEPEDLEEGAYAAGGYGGGAGGRQDEYADEDFAGMDEYEMGEVEGEGEEDEEDMYGEDEEDPEEYHHHMGGGEEDVGGGNLDDDDGCRDGDFEGEMGEEDE